MQPNCPYLFCITPPHMLESMISNGKPSQKERAYKILTLSGQMRGRRQSVYRVDFPVERTEIPEKHRLVYTADFGSDLPGQLLRSEGGPATGDLAADEAYEGGGHTFDLFAEVFERNSIDDRGMHLISTVHYMEGYDNAFWNGEQMVYGDGDEDLPEEERLFNRFTRAIDVIGHELTHGVTQFEAKLQYWEQSGALNESFSDVFGSLVKQRKLKQTSEQADWIIGEGLFTSHVNGKGIRSMSDPGTAYDDPVLGKDPQPGHMNDYVRTASDNGGVHINSGIPNRVFYLTATHIGGFAWEKAGRIWYLALRDKLKERSDFQEAADMTYQVAGEEFGAGSSEQKAVLESWAEVGITVRTGRTSLCNKVKNWLFGKNK